MQLQDFDYVLPEELIAQAPAECREGSRLMCLDRQTGVVRSTEFVRIAEHFRPGDVLVLNNTKVIPARLQGQKKTGGKVEVLLVRRQAGAEGEDWQCLTKSSRPLKPGTIVEFSNDLRGEIIGEMESPYRLVRFVCSGEFMQQVEAIGHLPLPPYIKREDAREDRDRYQTVFAEEHGAVAAPTAGLHFTEGILHRLSERGVTIVPLTLHVGLGTFLPVRVTDIRNHKMHSELFSVPKQTAETVNLARREKRRIVALGTTTARALETAADENGHLSFGQGDSDIFIYPGYRFRIVDALITNFHLPKSTLLMLVSAFAGRDSVLAAYKKAVEERFRFFSYGDCMLIS